MRLSFLTLAGAVVLAFQTQNVQAQPTTYDCTASSSEGRGFISERIIFTVDPDAGTAFVIDGVINARYEEPIAAKLDMLSNGHIRLNWEVQDLEGQANSFNLQYRLQYRPDANMFNIRATLSGAPNRPFESGTCKIAPGQTLRG